MTTQQRQRYQRSSCTNIDAPPYGKYYAYSSGPSTLSNADRGKKARAFLQTNPHLLARSQRRNGPCHASHAANIKTRGAHEFYNMMWDPSIYRGNSCKTYQAAEMARCVKKQRDDDPHLAKKRKYPRQVKKVGGIVRPVIHSIHVDSEKIGLGDMGIQTEHFLEELTSETAKMEMCTQIDGAVSRKDTGLVHQPFSIGKHMEVQTDGDFICPFEQNVKLIQKQLSNKILEQSILETTEAAEMEVLRTEKRRYMQGRRDELFRLRRLIDAQRHVADKRSAALALREKHSRTEIEAESRLGATMYSSGCASSLVSSTFNSMKQDGYISGASSAEIQGALVPLLNNEVENYCMDKILAARDILDDLLAEVALQRKPGVSNKQNSQSQSTSDSFPYNLDRGSSYLSRGFRSKSNYKMGSPSNNHVKFSN